jgi:adenylate kinase
VRLSPGEQASLNVVMLGPPGAGKGTQAERLAAHHRLPKISTGDILRKAVQNGTTLGGAAREAINSGNLVGDDAVIGIVKERLDCDDARCGFILDGFPRTVVQASALDTLVTRRGSLVVLDIVVPEDVLVLRLAGRRICSQCGANAAVDAKTACTRCGGTLVMRTDDGAGVVRERLKVYERQTRPLVKYYSARPTFRSIDGNQAPDAVTAAIDHAIAEAATMGGARL